MAKKQSPVLKWITKRAKELYRSGKGMPWLSAIKKASAEYRERKRDGLSSVGKKRSVGSKRRKKVGYATYTRKKMQQVTKVAKKKKKSNHSLSNKAAVRSVKIGSISAYMGKGAQYIAGRIGEQEAKKFSAKKKTTKRKIQKRITELKRLYRKLSK